MAHLASILICGVQEHVQKGSSFPCALVRGFCIGNILSSFMYNLKKKSRMRYSVALTGELGIAVTTNAVTHLICKGLENLQGLVMLPALTKVVVHKVRPKPGCPLSAADDVTHSVIKCEINLYNVVKCRHF